MSLCVSRVEWLGDWWVITNGGDPISDASVEGDSIDMRAIAEAIRRCGSHFSRRCAVVWERDHFTFHSPRNSSGCIYDRFTQDDAMRLAVQIEQEVKS